MMRFPLRINGSVREVDLVPETTLLDALREHAGLTGTKKGCDRGQCGACTVLINGRRMLSCLTLAVMHEIIGPARAAGHGVGAFNVIGIEHAEAIAAGAEAAGAPVVLQVSENCVAYHGALEPIARACLAIARSAAVPVAVHLDHATSVELVHVAAGLGLGSVMYDLSARPYAENVRATADLARWCQDRGLWVEAELGEIGGKNGVHSPLARTRPAEAALPVPEAISPASGSVPLDAVEAAASELATSEARPDTTEAAVAPVLLPALPLPPVIFRTTAVPADATNIAPLVGTVAAIFTAFTAARDLSAAAAVVLTATAVVLSAVPTPRLGPPIIRSDASRDATSDKTISNSAASAMQNA